MAKQIALTLEGKNKIEKELSELKTVGRQEIAEKIKVARSYGDLSENSEYDEAKNEQAMIEAKIAQLENTLKNVVVVDDTESDIESVKLGLKVKVLDLEFNEEITYDLVSSIEADPLNGKISDDSPLGKALIGHKVSETIQVDAPVGILEYKILEITR